MKKIESVVRLNINELKATVAPDHVLVSYSENGTIEGLRWPFLLGQRGLSGMAKRRGGAWDSIQKMWTFKFGCDASDMLDAIYKKRDGLPILSSREKRPLAVFKVWYSFINLTGDKCACLLPYPISYFANIKGVSDIVCVKLTGNRSGDASSMLLGEQDQILDVIASLKKQGAVSNNTLGNKWELNTSSKIRVKVSGWRIQIECDLSNPLHYAIIPEQGSKFSSGHIGEGQQSVQNNIIHTTRKLWPAWKAKIEAAKLEFEGDDPEAEITLPTEFNSARIPGWDSPATNGHLLHEYQKAGVLFCTKRAMNALIGDEMGIGKTAQAVAAAEAMAAQKILVICPANARYVWNSEIKGWSHGGTVQHISNQLDTLDMNARWHIATYDQLVSRTETWRFQDEQEVQAFLAVYPENKKDIAKGKFPRKLSLSEVSTLAPAFTNPQRIAAWDKMARRLNGALLEQILAMGSILVILDEAHRAKNSDAKRSKVIRQVTLNNQTLLLTGTPLRNHEHEAAVLLSYLDPDHALNKKYGYTIQDVKDYLSYFMIRRTKAEVLPELPAKTRQRINIDGLDVEALSDYRDALDWANESYRKALQRGDSEAQARQAMQGGIALARKALGLAKVLSGKVADLVADVVEYKECCVVFCAHQQVSDILKGQLQQQGITSAVVDGRTSQVERARIVSQFQAGNLQVFIGGINAAGEAITLTRADTVIFVELDWVPAALMQAEDRIHRVGQRSNCQIIQLIAQLDGQNLDEAMISVIGSKLERIGLVLDEGTDNIVEAEGSIQTAVFNRMLCKQQEESQPTMPMQASVTASIQEGPEIAITSMNIASEVTVENVKPAEISTQLQRGRPKIYLDQPPPSSTERSKRSVHKLKAAGGKRLMLRLTPEGLVALKTIMATNNFASETEAINQVLIARQQDLSSMPAINDQPQNSDENL